MRAAFPAILAGLAIAGLITAAAAMAWGRVPGTYPYHAYVPQIAAGERYTPTPTPTPTATATPTATPAPYDGPVASLYLGSAGIDSSAIEQLDTTWSNGVETLQDPGYPGDIAWYPRFGHPGYGGGTNSLFAAHINYYEFGNGPFAHLTSASPGDAVYVTMADGEEFAYTVESVEVIPLAELQSGGMQDVVYPPLDSHTERVTLISCGGDFIPFAGGGGEYTSRVVLVADRWVP